MDKYHTVLIALLYVLIFIAGCQQAEHISAEPNKAETHIAETDKTEPSEIKLFKIEPSQTESPKTEPNKVKSNEVESVTLRSRVSFHNKCADILNSFVDRNGLVDYAMLRRKRLELRKLLNEFDDLDPYEYNSWPKPDKIAFWINAYNIQMLNIIIENYPIQASRFLSLIYGPYSIRHIKGIWTDYKFMVMDEEFTLGEIQQRFFHKQFDEPRVFLALTNASLSGPILRDEPYSGHKLEEQLANQTKRFLSSPQGFKIDRENQIAYLSAIFQPNWYGKEFISKFSTDKKFKDQAPATRAVLNFIANYISDRDVSFLEVGNYTVKYIKYDWTINDGSINP